MVTLAILMILCLMLFWRGRTLSETLKG